jgi:hypothetical protein
MAIGGSFGGEWMVLKFDQGAPLHQERTKK